MHLFSKRDKILKSGHHLGEVERGSLVGEIAIPRYVKGKVLILKPRILLIPLTNLWLSQVGKKMTDLL